MKHFLLLFLTASLFTHFSFAQTNVSGVISSNTTWTKANSPYNITGNVLINSGATLTINPGVVINFSNSKKLTIDGIVLAIGTITDSITFTGTSWNGITTNSGANGSRFKYSIIENATGNSEEVRINLYGTTIIERCRVSNTNQGIMAYNSSQILYSKIYKTQCFGLYLESNSTAIGNDISYLNGCNNSINVNNGSTFSKNKVSNLSGEWGVRVYSGGIVEGNSFIAGTNGGSTSAIFCQGGIGGGGGGGLTYIRFNKFDGFKNNILIARDDVIVNGNSFIGGMNLSTQRNIRTQSGFSGTNVRVDATSNYWANVTALNIPNSIEDYNDDYTLQGNVDYSNSLTYHSPLAPISTPNNITKKIVGSNIVLTWSANTELDIAGYKVYYGGFTGYSYTTSADAGNVLTYTLPAGVDINEDIAVTAYDASKDGTDDQFDGNESWYSPANVAPAAPTNLAINAGAHRVKLTWAPSSSSGVNNYKIYRSLDGNTFTQLSTTTANNYTDAALTAYTKYYYKVAAFDSLDLSYDNYGLESLQSNSVNAIPTNRMYIDSTSGSDITGVGSIENPFAKISTAVALAMNGDTLFIGDGTYSDNISYRDKQLSFIGTNGPRKVILKPLLSQQIMAITQNGGKSLFKGLTFANGTDGAGSAIYTQLSNPIIENCIFRNNGTATSGSILQLNKNNFIIKNCLVYNNNSNVFLDLSNGVDSIPFIYNLTYANNTNRWFYATGITSFVPSFKNSIIWDASNITYQGGMTVENSIIKGGFPIFNTNIDSSPQFVDSANNDFHLRNFSPAIGLGDPLVNVNKDFENNNRSLPGFTNPDAGALESGFGIPSPLISDSTIDGTLVKIKYIQIPTRDIGKYIIYRDTISQPNIRYDSLTNVRLYRDTLNNMMNQPLYYRFTSVNTGNITSGFSNEIKTISFTPPQMLLPNNKLIQADTSIQFKWSRVNYALKYNFQLATDSLFNNKVVDLSQTDTTYTKNALTTNTTYYWRIQTQDSIHKSDWSKIREFQTYVSAPEFTSIDSKNRKEILHWTAINNSNIDSIKIYRDTLSTPTNLLVTIKGDLSIYTDTNNLKLYQKYYYRIKAVNKQGIESAMSIVLSGTPINEKPVPASLVSKTFENTGEFNTVRLVYSAVGSQDPDGKIAGYKWYVNNSLVNQTDSILIHYFKQGQSELKLEITDNDGATNFSTAQIKMSAFVKRFKGGILGGITALDENTLYTADSTFDAVNGASVYKVNRSGGTIYPLIVSSKIFTTPSVSSDSSVFITSGSTLNGFNSSGAPLWSTIPLGGLSLVTPTIDSVQNRLYVGVSNANFFAIDYKTGKVVWNIICDAPINSSAIITGDRKLVFASDNGTLYGFDLRTISGQVIPTWKYTVPGKILKSPAVDSSNQLYFGTLSGNLVKLSLGLNGNVTTLWTVPLGSAVQSSPVIDGKGNVYVGTESGKFYKLNSNDGKTIWTYSSKDAIRSTPTISEYGNIYIADKSGYITSLSEDGLINWKYQDSSAISSNLLTINSMTYVGTEGGKLIGFYDNPTTNTVNTSLSFNLRKSSLSNYNGSLASASNLNGFKQKLSSILNSLYLNPPPSLEKVSPVWGTFQGNFRRTGSKIADCPEKPALMAGSSTTICNGDIVKLTTSAANKFTWRYNGTQLVNAENTTSISVTQPGKYSVLAYGNKNCAVSSDTITIDAQSSPIKAVINGLEMDTVLCFVDSIKLSSSNYYDRYLWSNGDTLQFTTIKKSDKISLKGASSGSVCYSIPSTSLSLIKNVNVIPQITTVSNSLISTRSNYYKWFKNNKPAAGVVGFTFINPAQGFYKVETSLDNFCWDASADYVVLLNTAPLVNDSVSISTYPNPSSGIFNVVADFEKATNVVTKVLITDVSGKVIYQSQKLVFFSKKIMIPINLGTNKGSFVVKMDINGVAKTINILIN